MIKALHNRHHKVLNSCYLLWTREDNAINIYGYTESMHAFRPWTLNSQKLQCFPLHPLQMNSISQHDVTLVPFKNMTVQPLNNKHFYGYTHFEFKKNFLMKQSDLSLPNNEDTAILFCKVLNLKYLLRVDTDDSWNVGTISAAAHVAVRPSVLDTVNQYNNNNINHPRHFNSKSLIILHWPSDTIVFYCLFIWFINTIIWLWC